MKIQYIMSKIYNMLKERDNKICDGFVFATYQPQEIDLIYKVTKPMVTS